MRDYPTLFFAIVGAIKAFFNGPLPCTWEYFPQTLTVLSIPPLFLGPFIQMVGYELAQEVLQTMASLLERNYLLRDSNLPP